MGLFHWSPKPKRENGVPKMDNPPPCPERKKSVSELMGEAGVFLEFQATLLPYGINDQSVVKTILFALSLFPVSYFAQQNHIDSNQQLWYEAIIKPMFYEENIHSEIVQMSEGSCFYVFKARLKEAYILQNCNFR